MKFFDPCEVACKACSVTSTQRVDDLLGLVAVCPSCGSTLASVGEKMRIGVDSATNMVCVGRLAIELEKTLGEEFLDDIPDEEVEHIETLRDVARVVEARLPPDGNQMTRATDLVVRAVRELWRPLPEEPPLDVPLIDVIDPSRWERRSKRSADARECN